MSGFIRPIIGGRIVENGNKKMVISSFRNDRILSTYDGIVTQVDPNTCNGFIQIEHNINNTPYFSNFCNVSNIIVSRRLPVHKGEIIGYIGDDDLEYSIVDRNDNKQRLSNFFKIEKKKEKSNDKQQEKKEKIPTPKLPSGTYDDRLKNSEVGFHSLMKNALVAPFHITDFLEKKRLKYKEEQKLKKEKEKQEKEENQQKINEEINRIKKLLK